MEEVVGLLEGWIKFGTQFGGATVLGALVSIDFYRGVSLRPRAEASLAVRRVRRSLTSQAQPELPDSARLLVDATLSGNSTGRGRTDGREVAPCTVVTHGWAVIACRQSQRGLVRLGLRNLLGTEHLAGLVGQNVVQRYRCRRRKAEAIDQRLEDGRQLREATSGESQDCVFDAVSTFDCEAPRHL